MSTEILSDTTRREGTTTPMGHRDTFGPGDIDTHGSPESAAAITLVDGTPVSKNLWGSLNGNKSNGANNTNGAVNGSSVNAGNGNINKTGEAPASHSAVPLLAVTSPEGSSNIPAESPALSMPGGPPVNMRVPDEPEQRPRPPHRLSRSYVKDKPVIVTQYERPLEDAPLNRSIGKPGTGQGTEVVADGSTPKRPANGSRTNSRKDKGKGKENVQDGSTTPDSASLPMLVPIPVPRPNPAPNVPAANKAVVENTTPFGSPRQSRQPDPEDENDYEHARASFFAVPDPTRPETSEAYREVMARNNVTSDSGASVDVQPPGSTATSAIAATRVPAPAPGVGTGNGTAVPGDETPTPAPHLSKSQSQRSHHRPAAGGVFIASPTPVKGYDHHHDGHDGGVNDFSKNQSQSRNAAGSRTSLVPHSNGNSRSNSMQSKNDRAYSPPLSMHGQQRLQPIQDGVMIGDVIPFDRQQQLQTTGTGTFTPQRHQLVDDGPITSMYGNTPSRSMSFGRRPQPVLMEDSYTPGRDSQAGFFAPDHRAGLIGRSNTAHSRATGRNTTLSRASNGGTVGRRGGAFGMGAGLSVGTQPEEVLGRRDIHSRAEVSEKQLSHAELSRLSHMEKKDAKKLEKLMREEERAQGRSVEQSIRDLKELTRMQKEAIGNERKSQQRLGKWTKAEHRARMRFLKEKERYEKVEAELRNAENDFEERRDHAAGLTAQIAERTQDIDDLRAQKAVDDRERRVKKHAMRNPAYA